MPFWWIGRPEKIVRIETDDPIEEVWHALSVLKYEKLIKRASPSIDQEQMDFITGAFSQAVEYRNAAEKSSDHTRPLLIYYSFMNLVKAVLAALGYTDIRPYHGLKRPSFDDSESIINSKVSIDEGVFKSLAKFLQTKIKRDFEAEIHKILRRIVEMKRIYEFYYERKSDVVLVRCRIVDNGQFHISLPKDQLKEVEDFENNWEQIFPALKEMFQISSTEGDSFKLTLKEQYLPPRSERDQFIRSTGSRIFERDNLVAQFQPHLLIHSREYNWPQVCFYYVITYFLSMVVRYRPDMWYRNVVDKKSGEIFVISKFCKIAERVFPNLMCNILFDNRYVFG